MAELLETHLIEAFVEIARTGSTSQAARSLGRSQSAISRRLSQLEERLGVLLFERLGRGLQLTEHGEFFLDEAIEFVAHARQLSRQIDDRDIGISGQVTVGTFPTIARHLLVPPLAEMLGDQPEIQLDIRSALARELLEQLRLATLDIVVYIGEPVGVDFDSVELRRVRPLAAAVAGELDDEWWRRDASELPRYLGWAGPDDPIFDAVERHQRSRRLLTPRDLRLPDIDTLRALVRRGMGYTILPDYTLAPDVAADSLDTRTLDAEQSFPLVMMRRKGPQGGSAQYVWDVLESRLKA